MDHIEATTRNRMSMQGPRGSTDRADQLGENVREGAASIRLSRDALAAFSGGVDSSVVAGLAKRSLEDKAVAVIVNHFVLYPSRRRAVVASAKESRENRAELKRSSGSLCPP